MQLLDYPLAYCLLVRRIDAQGCGAASSAVLQAAILTSDHSVSTFICSNGLYFLIKTITVIIFIDKQKENQIIQVV